MGVRPSGKAAATLAAILALLWLHPASGVLLACAATLVALRDRLGGLAVPLGVALGVRAVVLYLHAAGLALPDDHLDAVRFHRDATAFATASPVAPPTDADLYAWLLSWPYRLLGASVPLGESLNVALQLTALGLVAATTARVWGPRSARAVAWTGALFPSLVLYGVVLLREALLVAAMAAWLYASVRAQKEQDLRWSVPALAALGLLFALHQAFTYLAPLMAAWSLLAPMFHRVPSRPAVVGVLVAAPLYLVAVLFLTQATPGPAPPVGVEEPDLVDPGEGGGDASGGSTADGDASDGTPSDGNTTSDGAAPDGNTTSDGTPSDGTPSDGNTTSDPPPNEFSGVEKAQRDRLTGRAAYPDWTVLEPGSSVLYVAVVRLGLLLLAPLPWWIEQGADALAFVDGLAYLGLSALCLSALWRRRPGNTVAPVVLLLVLGISIFAMATSNYGTAFRHRAKFSLLLMLVASPELYRLGDKLSSWVLGAPHDAPTGRERPRILFLNNDATGFERQRKPLVDAVAETERFETRVGLPGAGFEMRRGGASPLGEWRSLRSLQRFVADEAPDLVHAFTIKPVIYGALAARRRGVPFVATITGTGHVFVGSDLKARVLRPVVSALYRNALAHPDGRGVTVFQNPDDRDLFVAAGLVPAERTRLVAGSGVDLDAYRPSPLPDAPVVVLPARMLTTKGIEEFVEAARLLVGRGVAARMVLVGDPDPDNPASVPESRLREWDDGVPGVEWWGHRSDMAAVFAEARVVCLPSHGEGVPMALLEAAASARPLVATDVPGCREVVRDGETGLLCPPRDPAALADALERVLSDDGLAERFGAAGRRLVEARFDRRDVHATYMDLYDELLARTVSSRTGTRTGPAPRTRSCRST